MVRQKCSGIRRSYLAPIFLFTKTAALHSAAVFHLNGWLDQAFQTVDPLQRLTRGQGVRIKILQRLNRRRGLFRGGE